jgi:acrylyl-CoA reductase (NADPH)
MYKALVVEEINQDYKRTIKTLKLADLKEQDVLIEVHYSSLNYKDALSATGNKGVTKSYPHTPGIDASGVVVKSKVDGFKPGDEVLVTGYDLGMNTPGGFGQYISVPKEWVVKLPKNLSLREAMIYGTAGFTAALSVYKLIKFGVTKESGDILVTGASGGVGSIAVAILAKLGFNVIAATGKLNERKLLHKLGAVDIIDRRELDDQTGKLLLRSRFGGVIDTVGGNILATAIKSTHYGGVITSCGNAMSSELHTSVFPFILKGVSLVGIDSVNCPVKERQLIWEHLASDWKLEQLELLANEILLEQLNEQIDAILKGKVKGRTLIKLN